MTRENEIDYGEHPPNPKPPSRDFAADMAKKLAAQHIEDAKRFAAEHKEFSDEMTSEPPGHEIRTFGSGATRDTDEGKLDFEAALSPIVVERFVQYMCKNKKQANGKIRECDNWQGLFGPAHLNVCLKSAMRHMWSWWKAHRGYSVADGLEDAVCGVIFNAMAYLFKILNERTERDLAIARQSQNDTSIEAGLDGKKIRPDDAVTDNVAEEHLAPKCAKCMRFMAWNDILCAYNCFRCNGNLQSTPVVKEAQE